MTDEFDAVVYDLDGTLVRLDVDWSAVQAGLGDLLREAGVDPEPFETWELLSAAEDAGVGERAHELIAEHERDGAVVSRRLPTADELDAIDVPVGVCSLNCEDACHIALETHGLTEHVDVVAGRETTPARKPDPRSLGWVLGELGVDADGALFVGDSESDEVTAERVGTQFRWV